MESAMKKKTRGYSSIIQKPIIKRRNATLLSDPTESDADFVQSLKVAKAFELASELLGRRPVTASDWAATFLRLAESEEIAGFQVVETYADLPRGRGRPGTSRQFDIWRTVNKLVEAGLTHKEAISQVADAIMMREVSVNRAYYNAKTFVESRDS